MNSIWVRLGGVAPATEVAPHTPPTWETLADGGNGEASFALGRSAKFASQLTRPNTLMEIFVGCARVWFGRVLDFDRESGQVIGRGIHTDGNNIPALIDGNPTHNLAAAFAYANGSPWNYAVRRNGYTLDAAGEPTEPGMVWPLVELAAQQNGVRAFVDPDGKLHMLPEPTTPTWTITPDVAAFGETSEDQVTAFVGTFDPGTGPALTIRPANPPSNARAEYVDLTNRGVMTGTQANAILDAMLVTRSQSGWVNGVTLHREQITRNGTPEFLPAIHARNRMVRAQGMAVAFGSLQATWVDAVLGKTRYTAGEDTIYLEPANTAPRTAVDVWAAT